MFICFAFMYFCVPLACPVHMKQQESMIFPLTGVLDGFKLQCESWELNSGPLEKTKQFS